MASISQLLCRLVVTIMVLVALASSDLGGEATLRHPDCPLVDDPLHPVHLPHPNDCNKYYSCRNGMAYVMTCPNPLQWSILTYRCDYATVAKCYNKQNVAALNQPITSSTIYHRYAGDCNKFLSCTVMNCPPAQLWNSVLNRCDSPLISDCDGMTTPSIGGMQLPTAATPPSHIDAPQTDGTAINSNGFASGTTDADINALCSGPGISYVHYPNDCQKFIQCNGIAYVHTCPPDLYWNSELFTCDRVCK